MKKSRLLALAAIAAAPLFFASCGSTSTDTASLTTFKGEGFSIDVPKSWIAKESKDIPTPKNGSVALAMTSADISSGFANNILILKDTLNAAENGEKMTSKKYSVVNQALTTGKYEEYTKIDEKEITYPDADVSNLYVFEAKYNRDTPKKRFVQTAKICDNKVYLVTIGIELNSGSTSKYENLAKSFQCAK